MALKTFEANNNKLIRSDGSKINKTVENFSKNNKFRNSIYLAKIGFIEEPILLIFNAKKTSNHLKPTFIKSLILQHFDLKYYIQIETYTLSYALDRMLGQLNSKLNALLNNSNKSDFG